jgi:ABC-type sugar transport system ATPase subunit
MTMADKIVVLRDGRIEQAGTPLDLYNEPKNRFVAGFIGSPRMNFVPATVDAVGDGEVTLHDEAGNSYRAAVSGDGLKPGDPAMLGIRPDHLEIASSGGVPVAVNAIEQLGGESYLYCEAPDGAKLTAHIPGQTGVKRGDTVNAVFRPEFTHLFRQDGAAQTRLRIGEAVQHS